jgi:uncharacterized membrane protein (UPF0127 family)
MPHSFAHTLAAGGLMLALGSAASAEIPAGNWCRALPSAGSTCRALIVRAPKATLRLAVADTEPRRERGLMDVTVVPHEEGMLFAFAGGDADRGFWMKDTITPLDMVWVHGDGIVGYVAAHVPATKPGTPDGQIARREAAGTYVIELRAGEAKRVGIRVGTHLAIPGIPAE